MDKILGSTVQALPLAEHWAGVVEVAEQMGYAISLVTRHRSTLGRFVATFGLRSRKEKRLCNGTMREINLYLDCPQLREAISDFLDAKILASTAESDFE